jgi:hypothetical protein
MRMVDVYNHVRAHVRPPFPGGSVSRGMISLQPEDWERVVELVPEEPLTYGAMTRDEARDARLLLGYRVVIDTTAPLIEVSNA